ncbi:MAG: hypothetical protein IJ636_03910 [Bacteroidales bacterium]|nr:hypothetical protein [Bacteroidales bacterium]
MKVGGLSNAILSSPCGLQDNLDEDPEDEDATQAEDDGRDWADCGVHRIPDEVEINADPESKTCQQQDSERGEQGFPPVTVHQQTEEQKCDNVQKMKQAGHFGKKPVAKPMEGRNQVVAQKGADNQGDNNQGTGRLSLAFRLRLKKESHNVTEVE